AEHDQGEALMGDLFAGISLPLLGAALGGLVCVVLMAVAALKMLGGQRDEVIERLGRTNHGMDLPPLEQKAPEKTLARSPASSVRSPGWPNPRRGRSCRASRPRSC